jgi:hypothetical protein
MRFGLAATFTGAVLPVVARDGRFPGWCMQSTHNRQRFTGGSLQMHSCKVHSPLTPDARFLSATEHSHATVEQAPNID